MGLCQVPCIRLLFENQIILLYTISRKLETPFSSLRWEPLGDAGAPGIQRSKSVAKDIGKCQKHCVCLVVVVRVSCRMVAK